MQVDLGEVIISTSCPSSPNAELKRPQTERKSREILSPCRLLGLHWQPGTHRLSPSTLPRLHLILFPSKPTPGNTSVNAWLRVLITQQFAYLEKASLLTYYESAGDINNPLGSLRALTFDDGSRKHGANDLARFLPPPRQLPEAYQFYWF